MAVARATELSATSPTRFDDAVDKGMERAARTLRNAQPAWIREARVKVEEGRIAHCQVNTMST